MDHSCANESTSKAVCTSVTEIIFVRHGETTWNASGILQGQSESELTDLGKKQAIAVADRLAKETGITAVYSSDLIRAVDTAKIIAQKCGLQVQLSPAWRERHLGKLQGLSRHEASSKEPEAYRAFASPKKDQLIPGGGESLNQLYVRSRSALDEIANNHKGQKVVVVTHGGVLRALWKFAGGKSSPGKVLNASINVFQRSENDSWVVHTWCDTTHLDGVGVLTSGFGGDRESG
eukprot:Gb_37340 [translate_table: standard]